MAADLDQVREKRELDESHADPANWRGLLYFNKRDPRIFPPKPGGGGYTVNFANPLSVAAFVIMFVLVLGFMILITLLHNGR